RTPSHRPPDAVPPEEPHPFDFFRRYGDCGRGFAECHHVRPLNEGGRETLIEDLAVVCANCHRMIHRSGVPLELEALRGMLR
ncbi:MAG: HNH endonuclease, partial [Solirubrobacteraceae bacterium MAG38_C4-C5]|nr:HNH endonuclease [Candidatus Siliceabacter maunaloa]